MATTLRRSKTSSRSRAAGPPAAAKKKVRARPSTRPAAVAKKAKAPHAPARKDPRPAPVKARSARGVTRARVPDAVAPRPAPASGRGGDASGSADGLKVTAYRGDGCVLLAFDLDAKPGADFMGFAIQCTPPDGPAFWLKNRLSFEGQVTAATTPEQRAQQSQPSNLAPFQKFRWVDFSSSRGPGTYTYRVCAMYGAPGQLQARQQVSVQLDLGMFSSAALDAGFTRGFLSSQAYVDQFHNADIRPTPKTIDYDTAPYEQQYAWLGYHARAMIFAFLDDCLQDSTCTLDLLAYDLDEPDIIAKLEAFGPRLRAVLDDAPLHVKPGAMEILAKQKLVASAGADHVVSGHFRRFAHCKVLVKRDASGNPVRVLAGSANFSVRGLYVQANNVLVFKDADTARHYGEAFEQSFSDMSGFAASEIAEGWVELGSHAVCFSPHKDSAVSLDRVSEAIKGAASSVFFAIMELGGSGPVMAAIAGLRQDQPDLFTYGVTQNANATSVFKPGQGDAVVTPFAFLKDHVPAPFSQEISGGMGQVIHDKFIVVDFNTANPKVYTGSSNLAAGGEEANGDSLIELRDPDLARLFAVNAVGLFDHFHFRAIQKDATAEAPLSLDSGGSWFKDYFTPGSLHFADRKLFCL